MRISQFSLPGESESEPPQGGDGDAPLAEAILCGGWDTERDLAVLVGPSPGSAVTALRRLGQQRILWFRTGDEPEMEPAGVLRVEHLDEIMPAVRALGALGPDRVTGRALDPALAPLYGQVLARIERACSERALSGDPGGTGASLCQRIEQGLANLPALCRWPGTTALGDALAGIPLVIVAPGPSLARNINILSALRGRALLLALSHSLAPLGRAGITPDFVLAAEPHDVSYQLPGEELTGIAALIATATAHPRLFQSQAARHIALFEPGPVDSWLGEFVPGLPAGAAAGDGGAGRASAARSAAAAPRPLIASGGSVAHTALSLGLAWGCDPIGFVGLDLSFPGGQCYVEGSRDHGVRAVVSSDRRTLSLEGWSGPARRGREPAGERLVELPGWDGRPLTSSFHFSMCQRWFEETARRVAGTVRLYNCSEGGAYIGGMRHIRLSGLAGRMPPPAVLEPAAAAARAVAEVDAGARCRVARERLVELALELRHFHGLDGRELTAAAVPLPILAALVEAEMAGEPRPAVGSADSARQHSALVRWAAWLEPRVVEAERALAREERTFPSMRLLHPLSAVSSGDETG